MSNAGELYIGASVDQQQTEDTNPNTRRIAWRKALVPAVGLSVLLAAGCGGEKDQQASDTPAAAAEATPTSTRSKIIFPSSKPRPEETSHRVPDTTNNRPQTTQPRPNSVPTFNNDQSYYDKLEKYKRQPGVFNEEEAKKVLKEHGYGSESYSIGLEATPAHVERNGSQLTEKYDLLVANGFITSKEVKNIKEKCRVTITGQSSIQGGEVGIMSVNIPNPQNRNDDTMLFGSLDTKALAKDKRVSEACAKQ